MKKIKFIHTADLHLGSRLNVGGKYPEEIAEAFDNAIYNTFTRICDQAIINEVDFLLIAGDLFDQESRSVRANIFFNRQCQRLDENNIPVYLIAGNHDPLSTYNNLLDLPENVHIFTENQGEIKKVFNHNGDLIASISGASYSNRAESRKLHIDFDYLPGIWNIGLLHTQLELGNKNYIPSSKKELLDLGNINYWALGHIHQYKLIHKSRNKAILYPGIPQGRDIGEEGVGGAVLVEMIPESEPKINFLNLSSIVYHKIEIPIDSISGGNITDLQYLIMDISHELLDNNFSIKLQNDDFVDGFVVDWILSGRGEISKYFKEKKEEIVSFLTELLRAELIKKTPFIWTRKIIDRTANPVDDDIISNNPIFKNVDKISFLLKENKEFQEELLEELGLIWAGNSNHEDENFAKFELNSANLQIILEQAREIIIEELLSRRELS